MSINISYSVVPSTIDTLTLDAVVQQIHVAPAQVTDSPIESGAVISDHVILRPDELTIVGLVTPTPIGGDVNPGAVDQAYEALEQIRLKRMTVIVDTPLKQYTDMILDVLTVPRDNKTGGVFQFTAHFRKVTLVATKTQSYQGRAKSRKGTKAAIDSTPIQQQQGSVLWNKAHTPPGSAK